MHTVATCRHCGQTIAQLNIEQGDWEDRDGFTVCIKATTFPVARPMVPHQPMPDGLTGAPELKADQ